MTDRNETPRQCPNCDKLYLLNGRCVCGFSGKGIDIERDTNWQLNRVDKIEWIQDGSGIYVCINWDVLTESARLDILAVADAVPLQSFIGNADNVRKATMRWFDSRLSQRIGLGISAEHAAYIGAELERCDTERIDYIQS